MKARDVMTSPVITVQPFVSVKDVARVMLQKHISAVPVVDEQGKLVGIVSEGDLMRRPEAGTDRHPRRWLVLFSEQQLATEYVKAHATKVADIMTRYVVTATPDTPVNEIATLLEKNAIKRLPIVHNGQVVGVVSRANLIQALAAEPKSLEIPVSDSTIRDKLLAHLKTQPWAHTALLNVTVRDGVVDLWGIASSEEERRAIRVAAENTAGVQAVNDNLVKRFWQNEM
jgi:CBS domain-containing protein